MCAARYRAAVMKEDTPPVAEPSWLAEWIAHAADLPPQGSIILGSKCCADLQFLGSHIATYLNEFDEHSGGHWAAFNHEDLRRIAGDPPCRDLLLSQAAPDPDPASPAPDIDRVALRIAELGGAILEGQYGLDATRNLPSAFRVCLCCQHPVCLHPCHIWLDPASFSPPSLVAVIADSFLDWSSRRPDHLAPDSTSNAHHPASGAETPSHPCASL